MATKTLTITEDAYNLLKSKKLADESFSEEINRLLSQHQKRPLREFYGILSKEDGDTIMKQYQERKKLELKLQKKRMKELYGIT